MSLFTRDVEHFKYTVLFCQNRLGDSTLDDKDAANLADGLVRLEQLKTLRY